jgi:hypothetical protein
MKICYVEKEFQRKSLEVIEQANSIIQEYEQQGYNLTLRQLYYQFVSRDIIANKQSEYKRLGNIINDARLAGLVNWYSIEDRTRNLKSLSHWDSPADIIRGCADQFRYDLWEDQPWRLEVWIEKEALAGVFARVCRKWDVDYFSCRGYVSQSEMWRAGRRLREYEQKHDKSTRILHFGDHDPSGLDMTRDIQDRLRLFRSRVVVNRIALNMDQIEEFGPPPNPAKLSDSRAGEYVREYGDESWELDALEPKILEGLVEREIEAVLDEDEWEQANERQTEARERLTELADEWE